MKLAGATALVTGGSSGIGAVVAKLLAARGAHVLVVGRDTARLAASGFACLAVDLGSADAPSAIVEWAGDVDVFVGNAGVGYAGPVAAMTDSVAALVTVNITAHLELVRLLLPSMVSQRRGHVALVSSIAGCMGVRDEAVYSATKAALRTFADSLRYEVRPAGIGVSTIIPGVVDTEFFVRRGKPYDRRRPRPVSATKVASAVVSAVERNRTEVFVPAWLRLPARLQGAMPGVVRSLQGRFG
ncbi:SDR family NAD(P)-dependent oxidoreductase [Fodinicola acaciae]|uniref:SDR family NAD(P)-dependent oxidoreductase n=1 Tax=Fodinicola acaciae TaxID=2681555 RepID=UPI0013D87426|nr:SDR family NAD(P)-dependent oxidoreductase [Fodinicola acaciae]